MPAHASGSETSPLRLSTQLDIAMLRQRFEAHGHVAVDGILTPESAERLSARLATWAHWVLVSRIEGQHRTFDAAAMETVPAARQEAFRALVDREAMSGFQYLYENFALYEGGRNANLDDAILRSAFDLLHSAPFKQLLREVSGADDIASTDCQLTRYRPGHFLTTHDDSVPTHDRRVAYVLNMTQGWRADHGGQLQLLDENGDVWRGLVPRFNRLIVFKVPQPHSVSVVAPFAPGPRLAITGWARAHAGMPLDVRELAS